MRQHHQQQYASPILKALLAVLALLSLPVTTTAFVPMHTGTRRRRGMAPMVAPFTTKSPPITSSTTTPTQTTTTTSLKGWEDIVYHAESIAHSLAETSLSQQQQQLMMITSTSGGSSAASLLASFPIMYAAGLLTAVSPCVWGLLPLTMSYISTAAGERQDQRTIPPTLAFAAGLALVFCTLGMVAAELGGVFGGSSSSSNASSWILPLLSNTICFAMGLQLLDLIELPFGKALTSITMNNKNNNNKEEPILIDATGSIITSKQQQRRKESGSLVRTFLLGGSSALVASPCATPVLTSILAFVAQSQNPTLGAVLLFIYTLGYSTPLLLVASTGGQALVQLKQQSNNDSGGNFYGRVVAPWVTPLTGGILLWYGTNGILTGLFGDPSLAGLAPILE